MPAAPTPESLFSGAISSKKEEDSHRGPYTKTASGVVLDRDGKPCRTCTSTAAWMTMMKSSTKAPSSAPAPKSTPTPPPITAPAECPPDVDDLGRSTWTLLHTMAANYPTTAPPETQTSMRHFLTLFSKAYPCGWCAEDFQRWMSEPQNDPTLGSQDEFGGWLCRAHNAVNTRLGKQEFDCSLWKQRWKDGWDDGRCG